MGDKVIKEADRIEATRTDEYTYKEGIKRGYIECLYIALAIFNRLEQKAKKIDKSIKK